jgi:hypothetical protein
MAESKRAALKAPAAAPFTSAFERVRPHSKRNGFAAARLHPALAAR